MILLLYKLKNLIAFIPPCYLKRDEKPFKLIIKEPREF